MKKIRGDKPIGVVTHIYMETPFVATVVLNKLKCHVFLCLFSLLLQKLENRRVEQVLPRGEGWH
jgi:hypothetical protein